MGKCVAPSVLQENVMARPQELERGDRNQHAAARRHSTRVFSQKTNIVVDMLQHIHHQEQLLRHVIHATDELDFAPIVCFDAFRLIAGIDANAAPSQPKIQELPGEHA